MNTDYITLGRLMSSCRGMYVIVHGAMQYMLDDFIHIVNEMHQAKYTFEVVKKYGKYKSIEDISLDELCEMMEAYYIWVSQ
jgi:hypothetical protein